MAYIDELTREMRINSDAKPLLASELHEKNDSTILRDQPCDVSRNGWHIENDRLEHQPRGGP